MCSLRYTPSLLAGALCILTLGCGSAPPTPAPSQAGPFESDLAFLRQNTEVVVLSDPSGVAQVVVAPEYQGRVMTSTTGGADAPSFGWIGRAAIAARQRSPLWPCNASAKPGSPSAARRCTMSTKACWRSLTTSRKPLRSASPYASQSSRRRGPRRNISGRCAGRRPAPGRRSRRRRPAPPRTSRRPCWRRNSWP